MQDVMRNLLSSLSLKKIITSKTKIKILLDSPLKEVKRFKYYISGSNRHYFCSTAKLVLNLDDYCIDEYFSTISIAHYFSIADVIYIDISICSLSYSYSYISKISVQIIKFLSRLLESFLTLDNHFCENSFFKKHLL